MSESKGIVRGHQLAELVQAGVREGLAEVAVELLALAKEQAPPSPVPDADPDPTVTLKDRGRITAEGPNVVVVGFYTQYAAKIHEQVHAKHPKGGKAKYLEDPLKELLPSLSRIVGGPIHKRFTSAKSARFTT